MFEYYLNLVTDEFRVINGGLEKSAIQGTEYADKKKVKGKFLKDLEALQEKGFSLCQGSTIEISLQDILKIVPRDRKRIDAYSSLVKYVNDELGCTLNISSRKTRKEVDL